MNDLTIKLDTYQGVITAAVIGHKIVGGIAPALFALAKTCDSVDVFKENCADAEKWIRTDSAGQHKWEADNLPRCWTQAKSDIAAGMAVGLNPAAYKTPFAFKEAKIAHNKALQGLPSESPEREPTEPDGAQPTPSTATKGDAPMIPNDLREMVKYIDVLPELSRAKMVKDLTKLAKIAHDNHKAGIKEGQKRTGNKAATG